METTKKKLRIVNKCKESVTIDIRNAGGIIKMSWNIFKKLFDVSKDDTRFCYTKEETNETYNRFKKLLNNTVSVFCEIKDVENPDKKQLETLGKHFNDLLALLNCTNEELNKLIIDKYNEVKKGNKEPNQPKQNKKQNKKENKQETKQNTPVIPTIPVSTFGDIEALKQLKEKMNDKRGS